MFNATATFLINLAQQAPVVLLIDDLHAADETSLHLFHYLVRQTCASPVILLATYRTDSIAPIGSPFQILLSALYRGKLSQTLAVSPLIEDDTANMMAHLLDGQVSRPFAQVVFDAALGNPLFIQEITRALLKFELAELSHDGQWRLKPQAELQLPAGLSELLHQRIAGLGPAVEQILSTAAVVGREFGFDVLQNLAAVPDSTLLNTLDAALAGHLLEETGSGYRFRHPLMRRVLYEALSRTRRAHLHGRAAEAIEMVHQRRPEGLTPYVEALAFHYDASDRRDRALSYLLQAGQKAAGLYAFAVAADYFERALALMDELNLTNPAQRWPVLEALGWWGIILADTPRAVARFEQALTLPSTEGWRSSGPDRARLHRGAAVALITAGNTGAAERALMRAHCLTRIYAVMAGNRLAAGDLPAADQALTLGLAMSQRHGHCATCDALLLPAAVSVRVAQGDFAAAEIFCRRLDETAQEYASRAWVAMAYQSRGELAAAKGELDRALPCYILACQAFIATQNRYETARCLTAMATLRYRRQAPEDIELAQIAQLEAHQIFAQLGAA